MDLNDEWDEDVAADRPVTGGGYGLPHGPWAPFDRLQSAPPASGPPAAGDRGGFTPTGRRGFTPRPERRPPDEEPYADIWTGRFETGPPLRRDSMPDDGDGFPDGAGSRPTPPGRGRPTPPDRGGPGPGGRGGPGSAGRGGPGSAGRGGPGSAGRGGPGSAGRGSSGPGGRVPSGDGPPGGGSSARGSSSSGRGDTAPERVGGSAKLLLGALVLGLIGVGIVLGIKAATGSDASGGSAGTTAVTPAGKALYARIAPPASTARELAIPGSSGGIMSLDQFVKVAFQGNATERTFLQQHGFRVAVEREWQDHGVFVDTQLVQFATPAGARDYISSQRKAYEADQLLSEDYQITGVPSGYRWVYETLNSDGNTQDVMMAPSGTVVVSLYVYRPGTVDGSADLALMRRQLQAVGTQS